MRTFKYYFHFAQCIFTALLTVLMLFCLLMLALTNETQWLFYTVVFLSGAVLINLIDILQSVKVILDAKVDEVVSKW